MVVGCANVLGFQDLLLDTSRDGGGTDGDLTGEGAVATDSMTTEAAEPTFDLALSAKAVVLEPGTAASLTATITRINGFADGVTLQVDNAPNGVIGGSAFIAANDTSAIINLNAGVTSVVGTYKAATVLATGTSSRSATQSIYIRVGHLLMMSTTQSQWTVPEDVNIVSVAVWGGGGGAGGRNTAISVIPGLAGGAGAFAQGDLNVLAGQVFSLLVGGAGDAGTTNNDDGGGGGGGCGGTSIFEQADASDGSITNLALAAGGGSAGAGATYSGAQGQPGTAAPATPPEAGAPNACVRSAAKSSGNGGTPDGQPGTHETNFTGGPGGAGGYYCLSGGGYVGSAFANIKTAAGTGSAAPSTNHPLYQQAAAVGGFDTLDAGAHPASNGLIVVYVPE
jgi:hypothetical protein